MDITSPDKPAMEYLIRFAQSHETFRRPELEALARYEDVNINITRYSGSSPFPTITFAAAASATAPGTASKKRKFGDELARDFISRSVLARGIYEVWGVGHDYPTLHADIRTRSGHLWQDFQHVSFKFSVDSYCSKRSTAEQREIIDSLSYLGFKGKIVMKNPAAEFVVFEEWEFDPVPTLPSKRGPQQQQSPKAKRVPKQIFFGRFIGGTRRELAEKHDLKKRPYINTTSMDAELALATANLALAGPGKIFLDPFMGTGGFMVAAAELGAITLGADIDGRSFRGKGVGLEKGVGANFKKYNIEDGLGDCLTSDLTNTPFRRQGYSHEHHVRGDSTKSSRERRKKTGRWLDGIISDPPYGVREALKVLGTRSTKFDHSPKMTIVETMGAQQSTSSGDGVTTTATNIITTNTEEAAKPTTPVTGEIFSSSSTLVSYSDDHQQQQHSTHREPLIIDGTPAHYRPGYVAPKKPYSFHLMLNDILAFAADTLVDGGRLAFWMPTADTLAAAANTATTTTTTSVEEPSSSSSSSSSSPPPNNDTTSQFLPPTHPHLILKHTCIQTFNRWSRHLLIYERLPTSSSPHPDQPPTTTTTTTTTTSPSKGQTADDLNPFRKQYFQGFK